MINFAVPAIILFGNNSVHRFNVLKEQFIFIHFSCT